MAWDSERLNVVQEGVSHNAVINRVKVTGARLPEVVRVETISEVGELDELQTFVGSKNKIWVWTAVYHFTEGILAWTLGDRNSKTFDVLWMMITKLVLLFLG